jgi:MFS family permease
MNRRLRVLLPLGFATAMSLTGDALLYAVLPSHAALIGIGLGSVGILLGVNRFIRIFLNSPAGALCDRVGRRPPFLIAMGLGTASTAVYALTTGFWPLFAARLVWGLAWALLLVGGYSIILDITTQADRGRVTGLYHALILIGGSLGMLLGGFMTDLMGYRPTLLIFTGLTGLGALVVFLFLPETASPQPGAGSDAPPARVGLWPTRVSLTALGDLDRRLLAMNYITFARHFTDVGVLMATLGFFLKERFGDPAQFRGVSLGIASLTGATMAARFVLILGAAPLAGSISDRLGKRWMVVQGGLLGEVLGFLILAWGWSGATIAVGFLLGALANGVVVSPLTAWAGDLAPQERKGLTMGGFITAGDIGAASGPVLGYALAARWGLETVYMLCALLLLSAASLLLAVRDKEE